MTRIAAVLAIMLAATTAGFAQYKDMMGSRSTVQPSSSVPKVTLKGYLVDKACATHATSLKAFGPAHTTECTLRSMAGGLGVVSDGVWFPFDEKGSKKAAELLKKTEVHTGLMVAVTGNWQGSSFAVSSIKELKP